MYSYSSKCEIGQVQRGPVGDDGIHGRAIRFVNLAGSWKTVEAQKIKDENTGQTIGAL